MHLYFMFSLNQFHFSIYVNKKAIKKNNHTICKRRVWQPTRILLLLVNIKCNSAEMANETYEKIS